MSHSELQATESRRGQEMSGEVTGRHALGGCSKQWAGGNVHDMWEDMAV